MKKGSFDSEEKKTLRSFERGEWRSVPNVKREAGKLARYARNTMQKDKRINIRMSSKDLQRLQARALEEGIPYQTLISSILHKYVSGSLKEKRPA